MPTRIERIELRRFRGATAATQLVIDTSKPLAMIFGENGTGKSTVVDAIDLVCNECPGSISERSSTNPKQHLPSLGFGPKDLEVQLGFDGQTWKGSLAGSKITVDGPNPRPAAAILRRSQLLRVVESQPAKRYEELRKFIDVAGIEASEQSLKEAVRAANERLLESIGLQEAATAALTELWDAEEKPGSDPMGWAAEKAKAIPSDLEILLEEIKSIRDSFETAVIALSRVTDAEETEGTAQGGLRKAEADLAAVEADGSATPSHLIGLLQDARRFIAPPNEPTSCPVCEQPVVAQSLREDLTRRLATMGEVITLSEAVKRAQVTYKAAQAATTMERESFVHASERLAALTEDSDLPLLATLEFERAKYRDLGNGAVEIAERFRQAEALVSAVSGVDAELQEALDVAQADLNQFNPIRLHHDGIIQRRAEVLELNKVHTRLAKALEIVRGKRIAFTQAILDQVAGECRRLYDTIHPGEPLGLAGFRLDENKRGSLHQYASFQGKDDLAPQAYFSESHLDTLGFCVWLALAKLSCGGKAVIVLDDVFTSVDSVHLDRVVDLLTAESAHFQQIIMTTHYRVWRDKYRLPHAANQIDLVELGRWSPIVGIRTAKTVLAVDELASLVGAFPLDRQGIASKSGVLLEAVLDQLTLLYRCSVQRKAANDYTLGELTSATSKLGKKLEIERDLPADENGPARADRIPIGPKLTAVASMSFIRNQVGGHFNPQGAEISDADIETLGQRTVELVTALACFSCGAIPRKDKGTHYACTCGKTRMTPLNLV